MQSRLQEKIVFDDLVSQGEENDAAPKLQLSQVNFKFKFYCDIQIFFFFLKRVYLQCNDNYLVI